MFKFTHEHSLEVNIPIQKVWDFKVHPKNWLHWMDQFDDFGENEIASETIIKAKIKEKKVYIPFKITQFTPLEKFELHIRALFMKQISICEFKEISKEKTLITIHTTVTGLIVPICKSYMLRKCKEQYIKYDKALKELSTPCTFQS